MKKKIRKIVISILILSFPFLGFFITAPNQLGNPQKESQDVKLADIINNPEKWNGRQIRVSGYFDLELEGDAIYLSKDDYQKYNFKNSISLSLESESIGVFNQEKRQVSKTIKLINEFYRVRRLLGLRKLVGHSVTIEGVFDIKSFGNLSSGSIDVEYIKKTKKAT